jgi:hypothetical protein
MIKVVLSFIHQELPHVLLLFDIVNFDQKRMLNTNRYEFII